MALAIHTFVATDKGALPGQSAVAVAFDYEGRAQAYVCGLSPGWCAARLSELLDEQARREQRRRSVGAIHTARSA